MKINLEFTNAEVEEMVQIALGVRFPGYEVKDISIKPYPYTGMEVSMERVKTPPPSSSPPPITIYTPNEEEPL